MTMEEAIKCSPDILCAMTDAQLEEHFKPMLIFTRPEMVKHEQEKNGIKTIRGQVSQAKLNVAKKNSAVQKALEMGIDLRGLL